MASSVQAAWNQAYVQERIEERARCRRILEAPQAVGRRSLSLHLALETDLPPTQAIALLAAAAPDTEAQARFAAETVALYRQTRGHLA